VAFAIVCPSGFYLGKRIMQESIDWTRLKNDVNGNPRFVCHFTDLEGFNARFYMRPHFTLDWRYARMAKLANALGGRKYHTKAFGGGIVFQAYECQLAQIAEKLIAISEKNIPNPTSKTA
jgi:hypothetical protein